MKKKQHKEVHKAALWLDHSQAHLIRLRKDKVVVDTLFSEYETRVRIEGETADGTKVGKFRSSNREHTKHQKQQNQLNKYFKELAAKIAKYDFIYLFGPTTAKNQLLNHIRNEGKAKGKTYVVDSADSMTFPQMIARAKAVIGE